MCSSDLPRRTSTAIGTYRPGLDGMRGLAMLCDVVDPDVFVFGGGLSNISELYEALPDMIRPHVFSEAWQAVLTPARWGDSSGVRGAAWLWDLGDGG